MGSYFNILMVKAEFDTNETIRCLLKSISPRRRLSITENPDDADYVLKIRHDSGDWSLIQTNLIATDPAGGKRQAIRIAKQIKHECCYIACHDSDVIDMIMCDESHHERLSYSVSKPRKPFFQNTKQHSIWNNLLQCDASDFWVLFTESYVFAEDIVTDIAPFVGWPEDIRNTMVSVGNGDSSECDVIYIKDEATSYLVKKDAEPSVRISDHFLTRNPSIIAFHSTGGEAVGIRVDIITRDCDASNYKLNYCVLRSMYISYVDTEIAHQYIKPKYERIITNNGRMIGWSAVFSDVRISRGVDETNISKYYDLAMGYVNKNEFVLYISLTGNEYFMGNSRKPEDFNEWERYKYSYLVTGPQGSVMDNTPSIDVIIRPVKALQYVFRTACYIAPPDTIFQEWMDFFTENGMLYDE